MVSEETNIPLADLFGHSRKAKFSEARMLFFGICWDCGHRYEDICRFINRDRTCAYKFHNRFRELLQIDKNFETSYNKIKSRL